MRQIALSCSLDPSAAQANAWWPCTFALVLDAELSLPIARLDTHPLVLGADGALVLQ